MKSKIWLFVLITVSVITWISYKGILNLYLFNDEWAQLGGVYNYGLYATLVTVPPIELILGKCRFIGTLLNNYLFLTFDDNVMPISIIGLFFHLINAFLIYILSKKITKSEFIGVIAAVFFVSSSVIHQALTWPATTIQTVLSVTFLIVSYYCVFLHIDKRNIKALIISAVSLYISFLIKDNTIVNLPILIYLVIFYKEKKVQYAQIPWYVYALIALFVVLSFYKMLVYFQISIFKPINPVLVQYFTRWGINALFYPFISMTHMFFPFPFMTRLSSMVGEYYSFLSITPFNGVSRAILTETLLCDYISTILSIGILFLGCFFYKNENKNKKLYLLMMGIYIFNFIPISLFLNERNTSFVESRYLYVCAVPWSILIGLSLNTARNFFLIKCCFSHITGTLGIFCIFSLFVYKQINVIQRYVSQASEQSRIAKNVILQFMQIKPTIPDKAILYVESDTSYYVGSPLPFQIGPGYIFMVKYYKTGKIPKELLIEPPNDNYPYLFNYVDEGYYEIGKKGFGYFKDRDKLRDLYQTHKTISVDQIIGFRYVSQEEKLVEISSSVRDYIRHTASKN